MIMYQQYAQQFINRDYELNYLNTRYNSNTPEFIVLYGRRRIGKTRLITEFIHQKEGIIFLPVEYSKAENIKLLQYQMGDFLGNDTFKKINLNGFEELFIEFFNWYKDDKRMVFAIDEFPYLIKLDRSIPSVFQRIWDLNLSKQNVMLILSGSSIGMMETEVLGYNSPLYGRRTGQWQVDKLEFKYLASFFPHYQVDDLIRIYGCMGSIPEYLLKFSDTLDFWENLHLNFLSKGSFLYEESDILLREEFREPRNYMFILKTIAQGKRKLSEIANATGMDKGALSRYIHNLKHVGIIEAEISVPLTGTGRSKRSLYKIKDNYFNFYFRFVLPNKNSIDGEINITSKVKRNYDQYLGFIFEELIRDLIRQGKLDIGFMPEDCGSWWYRQNEIDIVATGIDTDNVKNLFLAEVKWSELTRLDTTRLIDHLKKKTEIVRWHNNTRNEYYGIIARKIEKKESFRRENIFAFDLDDIELLTMQKISV